MKTAVVGTGVVGRASAITFARAGHEVGLWDADLAAHDLLRGAAPADVLTRVKAAPELATALVDVGHIQEDAPEKAAVERTVFADLDRHAPTGAVLASSTSALLPSICLEGIPGLAAASPATRPTRPTSCRSSRCVPLHGLRPPRSNERRRSCAAADRRLRDGSRDRRLHREPPPGRAAPRTAQARGGRPRGPRRRAARRPHATLVVHGPSRNHRPRRSRRRAQLPGALSGHLSRDVLLDTEARRLGRPVVDSIEAERRRCLPADALADCRRWRDCRLMALLAHKRKATADFGK